MFSWGRAQFKEYGTVAALGLIARVSWSRAKGLLANKFLAATVQCPCCGWTGARFHNYVELGYTMRNAACPRCHSHPRHRALYLWLRDEYPLKQKRGAALVFAPEETLAPLWQQAAQLKLVRVDIAGVRGVDLLANLESLPLRSDSFDLIWCHHVLEHVENDSEAIGELQRVLRRGAGDLIVSVPMELGTTTCEYGFADPDKSGHWRTYGDDFADRLAASGLAVQPLAHSLSPQDCRRYGIQPEPFYICQKTDQVRSAL